MKRYKMLLLLKTVLMVLFVITACSKGDSGYSNNGSNNNNNNNNNTSTSVGIGSSSFTPATVTIKAGATVTWTNNVYDLHTVTADDGSFGSGDLGYYKTYSYTFNQAGTFAYHCVHHAGMKGTVIVNQ